MSDSRLGLTTQQEVTQPGVTRYTIHDGRTALSYAQVVQRWQEDAEFRCLFSRLLQQSPYQSFRWETPAYSTKLCNREFEFVLVDYPSFATRKTDSRPFSEYFTTNANSDQGIVVFASLGGDSQLITPTPKTTEVAYGHLAAFVRKAPVEQIDAMWKVVGRTMCILAGEKPIWLSTAGGGVAWLHVRIDPAPKYYSYSPYRRSHMT